MNREEYERRIAAGWDDTNALWDYWWGKVLFVVAMVFLAAVAIPTGIAIIRMGGRS